MTDLVEVSADRCNVLTLVLKGHWYDMIAAGKKNAEYRTSKNVCAMIDRWLGHSHIANKLSVVKFCRGYQKDRPTMTYLAPDVVARNHAVSPDLGEPDSYHYAILLDREVKIV